MRHVAKQDLLDYAYAQLGELLNRPGHFLYSGHDTLKKGDIYLVGFNPGGADPKFLRERMADKLPSDYNAYLDEDWANGIGSYEKGRAPLQRRIQWVLENLGANTREVCASNLIFTRSRDANGVSFELAKVCWPVHEAILNIVQPKIILTFGNSAVSPYGYMKTLMGGKNEESIGSGHGNWKVRAFQPEHMGRQILVVGLPHMSRYDPIGKMEVIAWIKARAPSLLDNKKKGAEAPFDRSTALTLPAVQASQTPVHDD